MNDELCACAPSVTQRISPDKDQIVPVPSSEFVMTPHVQQITERALLYLKIGYPVHFAGPAGTGKTTLAFHVAAQLGRPAVLIHGDDEFATSDLVGRNAGYRKSKLIDNFIHSVLKTQEEMRSIWVNNRLTTACQKGYSVIYDEFSRSRPEANNVLLSIISEKILNLPMLSDVGEGYLRVHPDFHIIFTSNPEEYAGVHRTQDALLDRMVTINLGHYDRETEIQVTMAKSGLPQDDATVIVDIVRELRNLGVNNSRPTIRADIIIAKVLARNKARARNEDPVFQAVCHDVLSVDTMKVTRSGQSLMSSKVKEIIKKFAGGAATSRTTART